MRRSPFSNQELEGVFVLPTLHEGMPKKPTEIHEVSFRGGVGCLDVQRVARVHFTNLVAYNREWFWT